MKFPYLFIFIILTAFTAAAQEGLFKTYYSTGQIESEINYQNNIREGEAKFYYENGNLKEERTYINGKVEGVLKLYHENGSLKEIASIENGKREGPTSLFNEEGIYTADVEFHEGRRLPPAPEIVEPPVIASSNVTPESEEINNIETAKAKERNLRKKSEGLSVPPPLDDVIDDDPAFFSTAEVMPQPVGGMSAVYNRLIYPSEARNKKVEGTVKVLVYINEWGDVTQAEVVEGIGFGCDEAAKTTLFYTKFSPGMIRGKAVKIRMVIPVDFKLTS
jgi:periplasmic protein TonB